MADGKITCYDNENTLSLVFVTTGEFDPLYPLYSTDIELIVMLTLASRGIVSMRLLILAAVQHPTG